MGTACGSTSSLTKKLPPDTDHKVPLNRTISDSPMTKPKNININMNKSSPSHSPTSPTSPISSIISPLQSPTVTDDELESDTSIESFDDEYLFQSSLILTQLFENEEDKHVESYNDHTFLESCKCSASKHNIDKSVLDLSVNTKAIDFNHNQQTISAQNHLKLNCRTKSNLFRPDTPTSWDMGDIYDLEHEMEQELKSMVLNNKSKRNKWKIGSKVEVYSDSTSEWIKGKIIGILNDDRGEWLMVKYGGDHRKEIQRYNKLIRAISHSSDLPMISEQHQRSISSIINENERCSNLISTFSCDEWDSEDMDLEENQMKKHLDHLKYENSNQS